jgi:hypothetical protein
MTYDFRVCEFGKVFILTDKRRRMRGEDVATKPDMDHPGKALKRWARLRLRRLAREDGKCLIVGEGSPFVEFVRDASIRAYEMAVWIDFVFTPPQPGESPGSLLEVPFRELQALSAGQQAVKARSQ